MKTKFVMLLATVLLSVSAFAQNGNETLKGDVNEDGVVDKADITSVINVMAGSASDSLVDNADVNGDGTVDVADIAAIIGIMVGNDIGSKLKGILLWLTYGSSQFLPLDEEPMAKFEDNTLIVTSKTQKISTSLSDGAVKVVFAETDRNSISKQ